MNANMTALIEYVKTAEKVTAVSAARAYYGRQPESMKEMNALLIDLRRNGYHDVSYLVKAIKG